jgi:hypothetical protein
MGIMSRQSLEMCKSKNKSRLFSRLLQPTPDLRATSFHIQLVPAVLSLRLNWPVGGAGWGGTDNQLVSVYEVIRTCRSHSIRHTPLWRRGDSNTAHSPFGTFPLGQHRRYLVSTSIDVITSLVSMR